MKVGNSTHIYSDDCSHHYLIDIGAGEWYGLCITLMECALWLAADTGCRKSDSHTETMKFKKIRLN